MGDEQVAPPAPPAPADLRALTPPTPLTPLPPGFVWGVATSAFQIEGDAERRGESIWDETCRQQGRIADGSDARVACDHVHRYREDLALLRRLGVDAYRFSIAWPRVMPGGAGRLDPAGLGFYDRLVDELLEAGIDPWVTLYHWDLPVELSLDGGGWPERGIVDRFADYATSVHAALGDRVRSWMTLNEPWCSAWLGYGSGAHAPGVRDRARASRAAHHVLLAHGRATAAMRAQAPADHRFGLALNLLTFRPAPGLEPVEAALIAPAVRLRDGLRNRWWLGAMFGSGYPPDVLGVLGADLDGVVHDGDLEEIRIPLDFLNVNYSGDELLRLVRDGDAPADGAYPGAEGVRTADPGPEAMSNGWPVTPHGLRDILLRIGADYPAAPPLLVTGNGAAYADPPEQATGGGVEEAGGGVEEYLAQLAAAREAGADVRGYFAGSLLDGFEWTAGYGQRFGLVRVDFDTLERRPRRSFEVYRQVIAEFRAGGR